MLWTPCCSWKSIWDCWNNHQLYGKRARNPSPDRVAHDQSDKTAKQNASRAYVLLCNHCFFHFGRRQERSLPSPFATTSMDYARLVIVICCAVHCFASPRPRLVKDLPEANLNTVCSVTFCLVSCFLVTGSACCHACNVVILLRYLLRLSSYVLCWFSKWSYIVFA